eukprot:CAMPEP_0113847168 /NCGR_PEP_ID=MMETSP0372-20130328/1720_1 /TAXON_ID=340204 /ORGANISM="Lankesteria abbotti" /LENGTH=182 /DNA_ID=CAMNT_0000816407 /DNA_START=59 /DNA_END=607 /DNA_ORIENTATION=- /assembly_acc=CAM_ASM_000359
MDDKQHVPGLESSKQIDDPQHVGENEVLRDMDDQAIQQLLSLLHSILPDKQSISLHDAEHQPRRLMNTSLSPIPPPLDQGLAGPTADVAHKTLQQMLQNLPNLTEIEKKTFEAFLAITTALCHKDRDTIPSVGSYHHHTGACKPCTFHFSSKRPAGCKKGFACMFCHYDHHLLPGLPKTKTL